jgi:hypothetical protein
MRVIDACLQMGAYNLKFQTPHVLSQHLAKFSQTSICHCLCAPERTAILDSDPEHTTIDRKHATSILDLGLEHIAVERKHAIALLEPNPEHC